MPIGAALGNFARLAGWAGAGAHSAIGRALGAGGRTAAYGAGAGAVWGGVSDDTSVIGGALMGAGLGLAGRYGRAGFRSAGRYMGPRGTMGVSYGGLGRAFAGGIGRRAARDFSGSLMRSNQAINKIGSTLKGWRG